MHYCGFKSSIRFLASTACPLFSDLKAIAAIHRSLFHRDLSFRSTLHGRSASDRQTCIRLDRRRHGDCLVNTTMFFAKIDLAIDGRTMVVSLCLRSSFITSLAAFTRVGECIGSLNERYS